MAYNRSWKKSTYHSESRINVHVHPLKGVDNSILLELRPDFVIMLHFDIALLRQLENFQVSRPFQLNDVSSWIVGRKSRKKLDMFFHLLWHPYG